MALTLQQVRTLPAFADMSDKDIINHAKAHGFDTSAMQPETSNDEAGAIRSYGTIPLLKGVADVGGAVGYGLEAAGIKDWGQALQKSNQDVQSTLTARQSQQAQEDAKKTIIDENGNYGGYNLGTLSQDVMGSLPAMAPMAALGAPLAKVATMGSTALGVGEKLAKISSTGALGKGLAAGLDTAIGSGVGFGASEGIYSGASNAAQVQNEIRNTDINKLAEHPIFADTYHNETDKSLSPEERLNQTRDILASKAGDDVFAKTAIRTGLISMATGGGVFGMMRGKATGHSLLAAEDGPLKTAAKGFALEGLAQELPQSAWEQRVQNEAKRDYADPNQDVNEGVINAGVQGGIAGGVMGLFGGAGGSKARPDAGNKKGETGVLDSIDTSNTDAPLADKADPQALRPWEEPSYADYKNQSEPDNQGYVPAEDGTLWESPDLNDLQTQADRASKLTAFHEKEQADIAQKDAELKAMALRADNTPEQTRSYRKKRLELRAKSDQLNKDLAEALKEATQTSFGPEVKNTQLSDQLQEKLNVNPTRNPTTKTNIGVTSELNPTDASTGTESGNSDTTTSAENPTTDQATTGKLTNDSLSSENQSRPDDVTKQSESALGQGDQRDDGSFIPTHTLNDGTPVQHLENNSYVDKHGEEWQADDAIKLPLTENKTDISTKNAKNTDKKSLNEKIDDQSSQTTNEASQEESGKENANVKEIENNGKEESPFVKVTDPNGKAFNVLKTDLAGDQDRIPTFSAISGKRLPTPILRADINHESLTNENISRQMEVPASGDISNSPSGTATSELQNNESQISRGKVQSEAGAGEDVAIEKFRQQLKKTGVAKDAMDNTWKVQQDANNQLYGEKITPIGERTDTTDRFNNHQDVINHITDNLANHAVTLSPIKQPLNTEATESVGNSSKSIDSSSNGQANKLPSEIASQNTQVQLPSKLFDNPIKSLDGLSTRDFVANHVNENTQFSEDNGKYYLGGTTGAGLKQVSKAVHTYGKAYQQHLTTALDDQAKTSAEAKQSDTPTFEAVSTTPEEQTTTSEPAKENANTIQANADVSKNGENVDTENIKPIDDKTKSNLENRFKENLNIINNPDESLSKESYVKHNNDIIAIAEKHGDTEFANQLKALQFNKSDSVQADSGKKEALIFSDNKNADPILPKGTVKGGMEEIGNLVDNVLSGKIPGNEKSAVRYDVELKNDQDIKEKTGLDISGYVHSVDSFAILKVNKDHGNEKKEASRGQLPITKEDWVRIPDVVANYDNVEHGGKDSYGKDLIRYTKSYPDGVTRYVEEVRNGRGELSAKTMWKTRTASSNAVSKEIPLALTSETASRNIPHDDKSIAPSPENATDSSGKITKAKAYHPAIEAYANDLVEGGGSAFTYDEYGKINGRTPSLNPEWFKDGRFQIYKPDGALYASTPSVKEVKQAVDDYKSGKNLKAKQIAILESLHDMAVSDEEEGSYKSDTGLTHAQDMIVDHLEPVINDGRLTLDDIDEALDQFDDSIPFDVKGSDITLNDFENWLGITNEEKRLTQSTTVPEGEILQGYTESELAKHERDQAERARKEAEAELKAKQKAESDKGIDSLADEMLGTYGTNDLFGGNPLANLGQNDTVPSDKVTQKGKVLADKAHENIQDVGEKLEGAKKFTYTLKESLSDDVDVSSVPLSKSFPQPDYEKLVESGVKSQTAAMIAVMRAEIPTKPQKGYKVKSWTEQVSMIRNFANDLLNNKISVDDVINQARNISNFEYLPDILNIADQINPARIKELGNFRLAKRFWNLYQGRENVTIWEVKYKSKKVNKHLDTKEEALNYIRDQVTKTGDDAVENGKTYTKFDIWTQRGEEGVFVGKKIAPNKFIVLKNLPSLKEARQYVSEHNAELVEQLKEKKQTKDVRRAENNERVGKDYRNGKNVTAIEFGDAFGFRGVQFGNWVNNDRRQQDLNNAYDGLMDLADVLNIPPKAIGLNGELGLAFGARGSGGVDPAAAHYESGQVVINLTKNHGAGSLAHEWWHAVDNYFGKQEKSGYLTEAYSGRNPYQVRQEVYQAWTGITEAIKKETQLAKRSAMKDRNRARDYWSTVIEMTARSFERYVIGKLEDQGYSNDYLANIIPESVWEADAKIEDSDYAFPLQSEMDAVNKAYDKLFDTLETKETDKGTILFSRSQSTHVPLIELRGDEIKGSTPAESRKNANDYISGLIDDLIKETGSDTLHNNSTNTDIRLTKKGVVHGFQHRGVQNVKAIAAIRQLIENAVKIASNSHEPANDNFKNVITLVAPLKLGDQYYAVKLTVKESWDGKFKLYDHQALDMEMPDGISESTSDHSDSIHRPTSGTKISVEQMISAFKGDNAKYLSSKATSEVTNPHTKSSLHAAISKALDKVFGNGWTNRLMATGKFKMISAAEATGLIGKNAMFHKVWHGSPHDHNGFDSANIGIGEGSQAFGWGHYFSDLKTVAEWYRDKLQKKQVKLLVDGKDVTELAGNSYSIERRALGILLDELKYPNMGAKNGLSEDQIKTIIDKVILEQTPRSGENDPDYLKSLEKIRDYLTDLKNKKLEIGKGKLYEVDLAPKQDEYLDWDKPLSEQSDVVKAGLKELHKQLEGDLLNEYLDRINADWSELTGEEFYQKILQRSHQDGLFDHPDIYDRSVPDDEASSHLLHSLGIRGIRYKAEAGQSDANNYVVFNDADVKIEAKYSKNGDVIAFYNPANDTTYLVHDNITQNTSDKALQGLMLHEIGVHALTLGKSNEAFKSLLKRFEAMKATNPNVQEAFDRVPADTKAEDKLEEALAYFIENNHDSNLAQKILEAFRQLVRAIGNTLVGKDKFLFSHWANKLTEQELRNMAVSALRSAPDNLQFDNVGRENKGVRLSQSAMKSVEANIKRGRDAMTKALLDKTTVHRAMFRQGMGWIDFEWGDEGGDITSKGKRPGAKGIAHIIEARQRKDRLSNQQTENLLFDLVDTIAKGEEIERYSYDHVTNIKIVNNNIMVMLTRKEGNNAWIVTGFEIHKPDSGKTGNDVLPPTHSESTLTRNEAGAGVRNIPQQDDNSSDNGIKFSRSTPANSDSDNSAIKDIFTKISGDHGLDWLGGLFTRNQLIDFIAKDVPEMMNYKLLSQAKDNATHEREQQVAKAYEAMSKKIQEAAKKPNGWTDYAKARRMMMELSRVQSMATNLENFDPAEAKPNQAMNEQEREVYDAYQALNDQQKEVYIKMRDDYRSDLKETQEALIENLDRFPVDSHTKSAVIADIKAHFDKALNKGVYFPLARFGKIVVTGVNPEGELVTSFVESNGARDKLMAKMDAQGYHQVRSQLKAEYDADVANGNAAHTIAALATNTIEQIRDNLVEDQGNKVAGNVKDMLDAFNQELIKALPDSSFRKHFIHRKGTLGESADTLRAYANTRTSTAKGLASIGYDHQIAEVLQNGRKAIRALNLRNSDFLDSVMNEFTKREKALKTTSIQPWAQTLTSLGFMGALGFNVASAGVNMLQVAAIGLPELAGRHGFNASSIAISKAYKLLGDAAVLNWESGFDLMKNPKINAKTKEALQRLHDIGKIDLNQTHDSISAGQNPSYSTNAVTRAFGYTAKKSGYFFHVAEALNRQVMGIAAFELEYKKNGGDFEKALAYTVKAIDDTQYDYGQGNRSRFMMGNTARVLTLFKAYALNTSWFIGRNAALSLAKLPSDERLQARKTLAVTMAMSFATSGLFGMPIGIEAFAGIGGVAGFKYKGAYGALAGSVLGMAVFQALLAGLGADDDDELETEFRNWLTDNFNQTVAEFITKGPARLLPIGDISGRTSMNHLWHQPQNKELEGRDEFNAISNTLMGPVASQIANVFMASKLWADGETGRALEAMTPRAVSNLIAADRLATHGVETIKGDKIVDRDLTVNEIAQKMLGFNPTVIANANDANSAITKERDKIDMEKQHLVKRYLSADTEERARLFNEDIKDFNEEVPASARITKMSLFRSMKARRGANKHTENGLYLSKKQQYLRKIGRFAEQE